jgi:hypothetical protein
MGDTEYYQVLGQAVEKGNLADQIKDASDNALLKEIVKTETGVELNDSELKDVKEAVNSLPEIPREAPGRKYRR